MTVQPPRPEDSDLTPDPPTREMEIPEMGLVVLCGPSGSGKSTFAHRHFNDTEIVSSDQCRALVGDDETDQAVTGLAFELLAAIVDKRLQLGRLTVVDATSVKPEDRASLVAQARQWDVLATAIVFDLPLTVCLERNQARLDRQTPERAIRRQHKTMRRTARGLRRERFNRVHTLRSAQEVEGVEVVRTRLWNDRRDDHGPFDIIGDVHGCYRELTALLAELGYDLTAEPVAHPEGRRALFLGDLVDRGPGVVEVLDLVMSMVAGGTALCLLGNHEQKLARALDGRRVKTTHGLAESLDQLSDRPPAYREQVKGFIDDLISHYVLDGGNLVVAHAGLPERYHGRTSGRVRSVALFGDTSGETDEYGLPVRYPWAEDYRGQAAVVYGHTPVPHPEWVNNTVCVDTGAVFGGSLSALRWPERELVSVLAEEQYYEPVRPLADDGGGGRPPRLLDVDDVLGTHHVLTSLAGRVSVGAERAGTALEVMSRFAADPRWLVYLPPTMAPVVASDRLDHLEHPEDAFAYYRRTGIDQVVCQEKHMGSRAVLVLNRDPEAAAERFGITNEAGGVVVTRTGRPFFSSPELNLALVARVRDAVGEAGWWDQLDTTWLVLDAEILPWSVKAEDLIRNQYAATGAAGTAHMAAAHDLVTAGLSRGVDLAELGRRTTERAEHVDGYLDAYRRYCWEADGLDGVEVAPFQLLAAEGEVLARRSHRWHLDQIEVLASQDETLFRRTDHRVVTLDDEAQVAEAVTWWETMTEAGGEGMVVKPLDPIVVGNRGLVLAGVKCRGREYLRIIYGPEYLESANLERLRARSVGHKSSMARRELALGLEGLDRFVAREHLHRVHECVFAVLALESEPVDPRL